MGSCLDSGSRGWAAGVLPAGAGGALERPLSLSISRPPRSKPASPTQQCGGRGLPGEPQKAGRLVIASRGMTPTLQAPLSVVSQKHAPSCKCQDSNSVTRLPGSCLEPPA